MISLSFDPLLPVPILAAYGGSVIALGCWMLLRRQGGSLWRVLALLAVGLPLCGPHLRHEVTAPVPGRVVVLVDDSPSMNLEDRRAQAETLRQQVIARLRALGLTSVERTSRDSQLRTAIQAAVAQVPPTQLAGVVVISDGLAHGLHRQACAIGEHKAADHDHEQIDEQRAPREVRGPLASRPRLRELRQHAAHLGEAARFVRILGCMRLKQLEQRGMKHGFNRRAAARGDVLPTCRHLTTALRASSANTPRSWLSSGAVPMRLSGSSTTMPSP